MNHVARKTPRNNNLQKFFAKLHHFKIPHEKTSKKRRIPENERKQNRILHKPFNHTIPSIPIVRAPTYFPKRPPSPAHNKMRVDKTSIAVYMREPERVCQRRAPSPPDKCIPPGTGRCPRPVAAFIEADARQRFLRVFEEIGKLLLVDNK